MNNVILNGWLKKGKIPVKYSQPIHGKYVYKINQHSRIVIDRLFLNKKLIQQQKINHTYTSNREDLKLFIALISQGNEFHIRGPLCLSVFKRLAVLIDEI